MPGHEFIYPNHPNFSPFLELAETTEMKVRHSEFRDAPYIQYEHVAVPVELAYPGGILLGEAWSADTAPAWALEPGQVELQFWRISGGLYTLDRSWADGYVNEGYRIKQSRNRGWGDDPQASEILSWGVGTLRPRIPGHAGVGTFLAKEAKRVDSQRRVSLATYIVDMHHHDGTDWTTRPYALESTNLVMPETLGELRQLSNRRDEKYFVTAYLADLHATVTPVPVTDWSNYRGPVEKDPDTSDKSPVPEAIAYIKWRWREAHRQHLNSGIWEMPPRDTVELIDRVDQLLELIEIDDEPTSQTNRAKPSPELLALMAKHPDAF